MTRAFEIDGCEPIEGTYTDVEAPINEAYLDIRDALEVYSQLFGRRITSSTTVGTRDGDPVIQEMSLESKIPERYGNTVLEGTVETQDEAAGTAADIEYAFTFKPQSKMWDALTEYMFVTELLDPQDGSREPRGLLPDAEIVLAEEDVGTMLEQGTLNNAEGRAATYIEQYARVDDPHDWLEPGDMAAAEAYADWMDHPFNPEKHRIAPENSLSPAKKQGAAEDGDRQEWTFRTVLMDREREKDTVTYTVQMQADNSDTPFTGDADKAGTITFTVPHSDETLRKTRERHHDSM